MKNQEVYHFKNAELDRDLAQLASDGNTLAEEHALDTAGQNLPKQDSPSRPFLGPITAFFNKGIAMIRTTLQSALTETDLEQAECDLKEKKVAIAKQTEEINNDVRLKKRELEKFQKKGKNTPIRKLKRWRLLRPFTIAIGLIDVAMSSGSFQQMGYSWVMSVAIGLSLGIAIYLLAEFYPQILDRCKTRRMKLVVFATTFVALTIVFYTIGYFRAKGIESVSGIIASPWSFAILNLFYFSVIITIVMIAKPTRLEMQAIDEFKILKKEIAESERKKQALTDEIERAKQTYYAKKEAHQKVMLYVCDLEALVVSHYESAVQVFITNNIQRRSDGVIPDMFSETPPPLTLHFTKNK